MPKIEQNFNDIILDLIVSGSDQVDFFNPQTGSNHYVRMSIFDKNDNLITTYRSDRTWNNSPIYYEYVDPELPGADISDNSTTDDASLVDWDQTSSGSYVPHSEYDGAGSWGDSSIPFPYIDDVQLPLYLGVSGSLHIKPNDTLDKDPNIQFGKDYYKLKFDFLVDVFDEMEVKNNTTDSSVADKYINPKFYLNQISVSRKEVRLLARYGENQSLPIENIKDKFDELNIGTNNLYWNLLLPNTVNIPILSYAYDSVSLENTSIVLKLSSNVSTGINAPSSENISISREIYSTQIEDIFYIDESVPGIGVTQLTASSEAISSVSTYGNTTDSVQSYNEIYNKSSFSSNQKNSILNSIFSSSYLNIDYREYENHAFFGSAEHKIKNFYDKIIKIENYSNEISSSISNNYGFATESAAVGRRELLFDNINSIINEFTPYERWLYYDNETTSSFPKAGYDYASSPPISGSFTQSGSTDYNLISGDAEVINNFYGLNSVYKISTIGDDVVISGSFESGSDGNNLYNLWFTGSDDNWIFSGSHGDRLYSLGGSGDRNLTQVSGALTGDIDTTVSPISVPTLNQFKANQTYLISFKVVQHYADGDLTFKFGGQDSGIGGSSTARHVFSIASGDVGNVKKASVNVGSDQVPNDNYNYLIINASSGLSASFDNIEIIPTLDTDGRADIFTNTYLAEDQPFSHYNGTYYLSFLANWPVEPTWENYNLSQSTDLIPVDAFNSQSIKSDTEFSSGSFGRYIYAASQSYWRVTDSAHVDPLNPVTATAGSATIEILSGSSITGSYVMEGYVNTGLYDNIMAYGNRSVLPSGELFRIYHQTSSQDFSPVTSSYITDVKIFREDSKWSGSISDVVPFSNLYSVSSSVVQNWYSSSLVSASVYDTTNINSLWSNLPTYHRRNDDDDILFKFMSMIGEHYDILKNYIDNYINIHARSYGKYDGVPINLINVIGENFGWDFVNTNSIKNLLDYHVGANQQFTYEDLTNSIWINILNNLVYIYKTKGTESSIRALLNCFGIPPDIISVEEFGGTIQSQTNPTVDFKNSAGMEASVGNVSFTKGKELIEFLNFNSDNNSFAVDWNTEETGLLTGIEFMFTAVATSNSQLLLESSGSGTKGLNWQLYLDTWSGDVAELKFNMNVKETGSLSGMGDDYSGLLGTGSTMMTAREPYLSVNNDKIWHVLLQRESISENGLTGSYGLYAATREGDTITNYQEKKLIATGSFINANFIGTGSLYKSGSNLKVGSTLTGSISEIRAWSSPLTASKFYTHVFNPKSLVGNEKKSFQDIQYRYDFQTERSNGKKVRVGISQVFKNTVGLRRKSKNTSITDNYNKSIALFNFNKPSTKLVSMDTYTFGTRSPDFSQYNKNKIIISSGNKFIRNELSPVLKNLISDDYVDKFGQRIRGASNRIDISISPSKIVNKNIQNFIHDFYIGDLLGDPLDSTKSQYTEMVLLRDSVMEEWGSTININMWIRNQMQFMLPGMWEILDNLLPSRSVFSYGILIQNDVLFRNKHPRDHIKSIGEWGNIGKYGSGLDPHYFRPEYNLSDNLNLSNSGIELSHDSEILLENNYLITGMMTDEKLATLYDLNNDYNINASYSNTDVLNPVINLGDSIDIDSNFLLNKTALDSISLSKTLNLKYEQLNVFGVDISTLSEDVSLSNTEYRGMLLSDLDIRTLELLSANNIIYHDSILFNTNDILNISSNLNAKDADLNSSLVSELDLLDDGIDIGSNLNNSKLSELDLSDTINLKSNNIDNHISDLDLIPSLNIQSSKINNNIFDLDLIPSLNIQSNKISITKFDLDLESSLNIQSNKLGITKFDLDLESSLNIQSNKLGITKFDLDLESSLNIQSNKINYNISDDLDLIPEINLQVNKLNAKVSDLDLIPELNLQTVKINNNIFDLDLIPSLNIQSNKVSYNISDDLDLTPEINLQTNKLNTKVSDLDLIPELNLQTSRINTKVSDLDLIPTLNLSSSMNVQISDDLGLDSQLAIQSEFIDIHGLNNPFINKQPFNKIEWTNLTDGDSNSIRGGSIDHFDSIRSFDHTKYMDPDYPDHRIKNKATEPASGISDAILNPESGSFYETQTLFRTIGDTENINLRGKKRKELTFIDLKYNISHTKYIPGWESHEFKTLWDATNPDIFTNTVRYNNKIIGRTSRIHIYGHWGDTHTAWNDHDGFDWNDNEYEIHYPPNHISKIINTSNMSVFNMTSHSGSHHPNGWVDPEGLITGETGAVIVRQIKGGNKTLKVVNSVT